MVCPLCAVIMDHFIIVLAMLWNTKKTSSYTSISILCSVTRICTVYTVSTCGTAVSTCQTDIFLKITDIKCTRQNINDIDCLAITLLVNFYMNIKHSVQGIFEKKTVAQPCYATIGRLFAVCNEVQWLCYAAEHSTCDLPCLVAKKKLFGSCRHGFCAVCICCLERQLVENMRRGNHCQVMLTCLGAGKSKPTHVNFFFLYKCR